MQLCHAFPAALGRGRRGEPNKADGRSSEQTKTSQKVSARTRGRGGHSGWGSLCRRNARRPNNSSLAALFQGFLGSKQQRLRRAFEGSPSPEFVADHYRPVRNRPTIAISHRAVRLRALHARQRTGQGAAASLLEHAGNEGGDSYTHRLMFMDTGWGSYCDIVQTKSTDPLLFVPAWPKPSRG